ncbi:flagellar biosynthesis protein FlhF [Piscinibacterium candidicorallinum]|uniref:Flagellar biosynthesis protein FlhF n=1 Tax=Piscinibacterium candidicorallinum TaxID=1793872 RepID=A0ABV7H5U6_9BURK
MNLKRFVAKSSREALNQVRLEFGDDAVIISNKSVPGGVEVLAMPSADVDAISPPPSAPAAKPAGTPAGRAAAPRVPAAAKPAAAAAPAAASRSKAIPNNLPAQVEEDLAQLEMSTLSFQDYVRQRLMNKRAQNQEQQIATPAQPARPAAVSPRMAAPATAPMAAPAAAVAPQAGAVMPSLSMPGTPASEPMLAGELRAMRSLIQEQLSLMTLMDGARRQPAQGKAMRLLAGAGFSPMLTREIAQRVPQHVDESQVESWLLDLLARNLKCDEADPLGAFAEGGIFALVGPTGVGKTTTAAKIAAQFAMRHGAHEVGLITVDTYRMAAHEHLRGFGRLIGVPVYAAADATALADLLSLLSSKKLVIVDTVGVGQRDERVKDLLGMLAHPRMQRVTVLNASAQPETLDDVVRAYGTASHRGVILSKIDESVKLGPTLDVCLRHKLSIAGLTNGQRVPEDWHPAHRAMLAHKALKHQSQGAFSMLEGDIGLSMGLAVASGQGGQGGYLHA